MNTPSADSAKTPEAGQVFNVNHPFIRTTFSSQDEEGWSESATWSPGVRQEPKGPEDVEAVADAIGQQVLTIVGTYKPGKFPFRVFYTRQWRDPSGKLFGKGLLRIRSLAQFTVLTRGYRHEFKLSEPTKAVDRG